MRVREILDGLSGVSLRTLSLGLRRPSQVKRYISYCLQKYDELAERGLPCRGGPLTPAESLTITIPAFHPGGGMNFGELVVLARVTKALRPRTVFEIGTYNGLTTALFVLNSDTDARIVTLDLPQESGKVDACLPADKELVASRQLASVPQALGLRQYTQLLCDSMVFDPSPYLNSVDLGLIDAAHDVPHVQNDTLKMAKMMSDGGIVFWHDYGGKGALRPLSSYLERLAKRCPIYRIPDTSLAWASGQELKGLFSAERERC